MNHPFRLLALLALLPAAAAAQVGIGTTAPLAGAMLEVKATNAGLLIPRLTASQRTGIVNPPQGLMVYQTDGTAGGGAQTGFWYYAGSPAAWVFLSPGGDNLGNGVATSNVNLNGNKLVGGTAAAPSADGVQVSATGQVGVGLGAATPTEQMQVDGGNLKVGAATWATTANDRLLKFGDGSYVALGEAGADDVLQLQAKDFRFNPSVGNYTGNVGIGLGAATAASERLEVAGSLKLSGTAGTDGIVFPDGTRQTTAVSTSGGLTLPYAGTASSGGNLFAITNTGAGIGVRGASASGQGVVGRVNGTGAGQGVVGVKGTSVPNIANAGVVGLADTDPAVYAASNSNAAVVATTATTARQAAVQGTATSTASGTLAAGVSGTSNANDNSTGGVVGSNYGGGQAVGVLGTTTNGYGVRVVASANGGYGVSGTAIDGYGVTGTSTSGIGTYGGSTSSYGVQGYSTSSSGVQGTTAGSYGSTVAGVLGTSTNSSGAGVLGTTTSGYGVRGEATGSSGYGVTGTASGTNGYALLGAATGGASGLSASASGTGRAAYFTQTSSSSTANALEVQNAGLGRTALFNQSNSSNTANALEVQNSGNGSAALMQNNSFSDATLVVQNRQSAIAVDLVGDIVLRYSSTGAPLSRIYTNNPGQTIFGAINATGSTITERITLNYSNNSGVLVNALNGNWQVTGSLSKGGGSFKIDHPLDPENQYLYHSFVESPDMLNVYNGNVTLDAKGEATVQLPDYFEALNRDFRYQLTAIGAPGPNLYVAQEVQRLSFRIAGGTPGGKVSWQVTGIRHDKWANQNRIKNAEAKEPENQGKYLYPEAFGQPAERGIFYRPQPAAQPAPAAMAPTSTTETH